MSACGEKSGATSDALDVSVFHAIVKTVAEKNARAAANEIAAGAGMSVQIDPVAR